MPFEGLQLGFTDASGRVPRQNRAFVVTELRRNGTGTFVPTPVQFVWDAATQTSPRPSWKFSLKQRTNRVDYPGSDEPTEQILGPAFQNFTVDGIWDDRYAGAGFAWDTHQAFEQLVARGNFVRIEFEELGITGVIVHYAPEYIRKNYIKYSFVVSPHFRQPGGIARADKPKVPIALTAPEQLVRSISDVVGESADEHNGILQKPLASVTGAIDNVSSEVDRWIAKVDEMNTIVEQQFFGPIDQVLQAARRLSASVQSIQQSAEDMLIDIGSLTSDAELAYASAMDTLDFQVWKSNMGALARTILFNSSQAQESLDERFEPTVKAVYKPHLGENLYSISQQFYNTPHNWRKIQDVNGLSYITLTGRETLIIPEVK